MRNSETVCDVTPSEDWHREVAAIFKKSDCILRPAIGRWPRYAGNGGQISVLAPDNQPAC
jgi:hypothetical protein